MSAKNGGGKPVGTYAISAPQLRRPLVCSKSGYLIVFSMTKATRFTTSAWLRLALLFRLFWQY